MQYHDQHHSSWREQKKEIAIRKTRAGAQSKARFIKAWNWAQQRLLTKTFGKITIIIFILGLFAVFATVIFLSRQLPDPNKLMDRQVAQSTKIYDRTGQTVLYEIHGGAQRTMVNINDIPAYVKEATIAIEDKDFYRHSGFSLWAIARTAITNLLFNRKAGGSTLTQQFVKNAILTTEKSYIRKAKELILAYRIEKNFNKDQILQMYFNEIPYGSTAYGVEAASQKYFGKDVKNINLAEAAVLAAMVQRPSKYSPFGPNRDILISRQQYVLDLMAEQGYISKDEAETAKNTPLKFSTAKENIIAPHFVMYVKEMLSEKYGEKEIEQGGYKIITSLDLFKQQAAEEIIASSTENYPKKYKASNAALLSLDPKTGEILAMVGSRDYFNEEIDGQVNLTTSPRQPGSSFKPIVYAGAFTKGFTPNTILYDVVTNFSTDPANRYEPRNYNNHENGPIAMKKALAGSLNIPAVKAFYLAGMKDVHSLAQSLGYTTMNSLDNVGLSLVLGGGEVKMVEHANAYAAFARDGYINPVTAILKIEDGNGKTLEEYKANPKKALESNVARMINDSLSDNNNRAFIFGSSNYLTLGKRPVAAKTGTTNDWRDAWTIGYTPSLVTAVWVGNNDFTIMKPGSDGSIVAAPLWNKYMKRVLGDTPIEYFTKPKIPRTGKAVLDGGMGEGDIIKIDRASGLLATEYTPSNWIEERTYKDVHNILYYVDKNDPAGPYPSNPYSDPQFLLWERPVLAWAAKNKIATSSPPTEKDNLHIPENLPILNILSPVPNQIITETVLQASIQVSAPRGIDRVEYYLNDNLLSTEKIAPYNLNKPINFLNNGYHSVRVKVCDDIDNCTENTFDINLALSDNPIQNNNISISWTEMPGDQTISSSTFSLPIKLLASDPSHIAKINVYYSKESESPKLLYSFAPIDSNTLSTLWSKSPGPGIYSVFAEAIGWNGQKTKTDNIIVRVKK